ncbi:MAG TPA: DMT family transporter, partial [Nocardioides sp.]|nr:DMT family transporter [Nocardioides sp.]
MALTPPSRATDVVGGLALVVAWSSGFIGAELGTRDASASTLLAWRYVVATAALVLFVAWKRRGWRVRRPWRHAAIGLLCQATYLGGVVGGVGLGVPPGTAALIAAWQPLLVSVLEHLLLGRTTSRAQRVGLSLGLVGVALVVSSDLGRGTAPAWAYLLPLAGMVGLSVGTVLDRRWRLDDDAVTGLTAQSAVVAVVMIAGAQVASDLAPPASST